MIINEIDEKNSANNRTVDTETGIYLKATGADLREHIYFFVIRDGDVALDIATYRENRKIDQAENIFDVSYLVDMVYPTGKANKRDYISIIEKLLEKCGDSFGYNVRRFGAREKVHVEFSPGAVEKLKKWQAE